MLELLNGTLNGGIGNDTLYLPDGLTVAGVTAMGVTVSDFETVLTLKPWEAGFSECAQ